MIGRQNMDFRIIWGVRNERAGGSWRSARSWRRMVMGRGLHGRFREPKFPVQASISYLMEPIQSGLQTPNEQGWPYHKAAGLPHPREQRPQKGKLTQAKKLVASGLT